MRLASPLILGLCLLASIRPVAAANFVVGVESIDYLPHYAVENGEYVGFGRAVLDAYAQDRGHGFEYRALPVSRLFREFVQGNIDFKYPDHPNWQRDIKTGRAVVYSDPVVAYIDGVVVQPSKLGQGAERIRTLGTVHGFTAWDWLGPIKAGTVKLEENPHFQDLVKQALWGRIDGAYANVAVVNHQLETVFKQPGGLIFDPALPHTRGSYFLSSIKHPEIIADFNAWLKANPDKLAKLKTAYAVEKGVQ